MLTDSTIADRTPRPRGGIFARNLEIRGYHMIYRDDQVNHCPGCGRAHWYIGRQTAECGFCGTAIPLAESVIQSAAGGHSRNRRQFIPSDFAV